MFDIRSSKNKGYIRIIPVYSPQRVSKFANKKHVEPYCDSIDNYSIVTAPLAIGSPIDILGISQSEELLSKGLITNRDIIDPNVSIKAIYVKVGNNIGKIDTLNMCGSSFIQSGTSSRHILTLNFKIANTYLHSDKINNICAETCIECVETYVETILTGCLNLESGELLIYGTVLNVIPPQEKYKVSIVGYEIEAYRIRPDNE